MSIYICVYMHVGYIYVCMYTYNPTMYLEQTRKRYTLLLTLYGEILMV